MDIIHYFADFETHFEYISTNAIRQIMFMHYVINTL